MRSRIPRASLLFAASAAVLIGSTSCAASAAGKNEVESSGSAATDAAASASLLRGADSTSKSTALIPISVRGEAKNDKPNSSQRQLGSTFSQNGSGGSIASVIQGLLSVLDKTEVDSGNGCTPSRPCRLCEGDCDTDEDVSALLFFGLEN